MPRRPAGPYGASRCSFAQRGSAPGRRRPVRPCAMLTKLGTPPEETHYKISCGPEWLGRPYGAMRRRSATPIFVKIPSVLLLGLRLEIVRSRTRTFTFVLRATASPPTGSYAYPAHTHGEVWSPSGPKQPGAVRNRRFGLWRPLPSPPEPPQAHRCTAMGAAAGAPLAPRHR